MNSPQGCFYEFGPFRLDPAKRLLLRDGAPVPLKPKVFETLLTLVEAQGQALEKDELMKRIWPDSVVEENNLNVYISQLRKALGESPDEHRYIVTIPGRGYRFVAEVRIASPGNEKRAEPAPAAPEPQQQTPDHEITTPLLPVAAPAQGNGRRRNIALILTAAPILVLGLGLGMSRFISKRSAAAFHSVKLKRLTETGNIIGAAVSPDGKYVAYVRDEDGKQCLRLKQVGTDSDISIIPPSDAPFFNHSLIFSPDGQSLYFVGWDKKANSNALYQLPMLGGIPRRVMARVHSAVTFSPDGNRLAFARDYPDQQESALLTANADGSGEQTLTVCKTPDSLLSFMGGPAWSSDGSVIVSPIVIKAGGMHCELLEVRLSDGATRRITTPRWNYIGRLFWLPNGGGLVMAATEETYGAPQLWLLSWPDGSARRITQDLARYYGLSATADASALVTVQTEELNSIWIAPSAEPGQPVKIVSGRNDIYAGICWTSDGKVIYASRNPGNGNLWITEVGGGQPRMLPVESVIGWPDASPDGRYVVYAANQNGYINVWRIDRDGGDPLQLTSGNYDIHPRCSADGKWVVYVSREGGAAFALMKAPIEGGKPVRIEQSAWLPAVSPDGKWIAYSSQYTPPWNLVVIPFEGGPPAKVFENQGGPIQWSADSLALTSVKTVGGVSNLWSQPLAGGPPKQITNFGTDWIADFAWSRDGRQMAFRRRVMSSDIVLVSDAR